MCTDLRDYPVAVRCTEQGTTLIELVMAIAIAGVMIVGLMTAYASIAGRSLEQKNLRIGLMALVMAAVMVGMGFAAVPLYQMFCQVTGFGGTTQVASESDAAMAERLAASAGAPPISTTTRVSRLSGISWP